MPLRNIKTLVEYDGTDFAGFQIQPENWRTVQGEITEVLSEILNHPLKITGASRTDAGAHATGQVIAFKTSASRTLQEIKYGANKRSPGDWRFTDLAEVNWEFNPRYDARAKTYQYFVDRTGSVLRRRYSWNVTADIDTDVMRQISHNLIGERDFRSFTTSGAHRDDSTIRRIDSVEIIDMPTLLRFDITGSGFLYQMVRRIVKALVNAGTGRMAPDEFQDLLSHPDFDRIESAAPAKGLILKNVLY